MAGVGPLHCGKECGVASVRSGVHNLCGVRCGGCNAIGLGRGEVGSRCVSQLWSIIFYLKIKHSFGHRLKFCHNLLLNLG